MLRVEAFGRLAPRPTAEGGRASEEDLYSVFRARAELMGWSMTGARLRPLTWGMNDAELTAGSDGRRIGWVQVGLDEGVEPALALVPLVQCFHDALGRFGVVELTGLHVTGSALSSAGSCAADLVSGLNWFKVTPNASVNAVIVVEDDSLSGRLEPELVASLERLNTDPFEFRPRVNVGPDRVDPCSGRPRLGVAVTLPERTADAAAWATTMAIDASGPAGPSVRTLRARATLS